jgi:hypothetical protein
MSGSTPRRRPKERVGRQHIALHPPEERAVHAIFPPIAQPLLLLLFWGALRSLLRGGADVGVGASIPFTVNNVATG